jgi:hypothetical protein
VVKATTSLMINSSNVITDDARRRRSLVSHP